MEYVSAFATPEELQKSRDRLFRPLLVDGLAMMKLLEQQELAAWLETVQRQYLDVVKRNQAVRMADEMDLSMIDRSIEGIIEIIKQKIQDSVYRQENFRASKRPEIAQPGIGTGRAVTEI